MLKKYKNVIFIIIGEGDQRRELENLAKHEGVFSNFYFLGWVDYKNLVKYYNAADVFILPSVRDSDGNLDDQSVAVVEAMACGKPIITTDFPGYRRVVNEGENGFLVPEKDSEAITEVLKNLIASRTLREKMGERSRQLVEAKFSWKKIGKEYTSLFESLALK